MRERAVAIRTIERPAVRTTESPAVLVRRTESPAVRRTQSLAVRRTGHPAKRRGPPVWSRGKDCTIPLVYAMEDTYRIDVTLCDLILGVVGV
jgi:hypothetical protein